MLVITVAALAMSAAAAFACVPLRSLISIEPDGTGPVGSEMTVKGVSFSERPVEIRWNGLEGPQLGAANGPTFSVTVKVPAAPEGLYSVIAFSRAQDGGIQEAGTASFFVTAADAGPVAARSPRSTGTGSYAQPASASRVVGKRGGAPTLAWVFGLVLLGALVGVAVSGRLSRKLRRQSA